MPQTDIGSAEASNLSSAVTDFSVASEITDAANEGVETRWNNERWSEYFGYYKKIPELNAVIDAKATWTVGKGFKADEDTETILETITGWGKDTFNTIIENMIRTYHIGGDAFAEIIRTPDGELLNLKPLDPSSIVIIVNKKGIVQRYEQQHKSKKPNRPIAKEDILHFARNRVADEIHGVSLIEKLEEIILMRNEAMTDWKRVLHRNVDPMMIFHLDTDDTTKIANFKATVDAARGAGENMYVPKDAVVPELLTTAQNATLNPTTWIQELNNYFYEAAGVPKIIIGNAQEFTEASAKISYLAFQQTIEEEQLFVEEQLLLQLGIEVEFEFPASLDNELLSDQKKDGPEQAAQPNDTTAPQLPTQEQGGGEQT